MNYWNNMNQFLFDWNIVGSFGGWKKMDEFHTMDVIKVKEKWINCVEIEKNVQCKWEEDSYCADGQ